MAHVKEASSRSMSVRRFCFFILRIELTMDDTADSGNGALRREGDDSRAAAGLKRNRSGEGLSTLEEA